MEKSEPVWEKADCSGTVPPSSFGHTATQISKAKVVLFGGATGGDGKYSMTGDTYIYNVFNCEWSKLQGIFSPFRDQG